MITYIKYLLLLSILCANSSAYSLTIDPRHSDQDYIEYGTKHECVLPIFGTYKDREYTKYRGSCVMINQYCFLTAAHVVHDSLSQYVIWNNEPKECIKIVIHNNFMIDNMGYYDIAIGKLKDPIKLDFYPSLYEETNEVKKICSQAGYGFTGTFETGFSRNNFDNKRRAGSNIIIEIEKHMLVCSITDSPKTSLESLITPGDSGGGLFINQKLAGIHSCVYAIDGKADSNYGDTSGHTRISNFINWINTQLKLLNNNE